MTTETKLEHLLEASPLKTTDIRCWEFVFQHMNHGGCVQAQSYMLLEKEYVRDHNGGTLSTCLIPTCLSKYRTGKCLLFLFKLKCSLSACHGPQSVTLLKTLSLTIPTQFTNLGGTLSHSNARANVSTLSLTVWLLKRIQMIVGFFPLFFECLFVCLFVCWGMRV